LGVLYLVYDFYRYQKNLAFFDTYSSLEFFEYIDSDKDDFKSFEEVYSALGNWHRWGAWLGVRRTITGLLKDGDYYFGMTKIEDMKKSFLQNKFNESDRDEDGFLNYIEFRDWLNSVKGGKNM
jgi:hypothetical protein